MKRRIVPAFLVLCVIFAIVPHSGAAAAGMSGLQVTGQAMMTQQMFTDLSVIGADSCGLTDAINGSKNPAQTIGEWIKGYWDSWLLRQQLTWGTVLNIAAAGARYTGNGDLLFNSQLSDLFTRFYNWLWDGEDGPNISENAETMPGEKVEGYISLPQNFDPSLYLRNPSFNYNIHFGDELTTNRNDGNIITYQSVNGSKLFFCNRYYIAVGPNNGPLMKLYRNGSLVNTLNGHVVTAKIGTLYYAYTTGNQESNNYTISGPVTTVTTSSGSNAGMDDSIVADIAYLIFNYGVEIGDDQILGDPDKLGGLTGSERKRVAPPDIIDFPDFGGNGGFIDVSDYLGALRDAIESQDGTADVNITDSQGVESIETMTIDQTTDIPAETEDTSDTVDQGDFISTATPSTELSDYTLDLRNYFPFCIPWDLYDMLTILVADPVAPHVQYPFVIEPLNVNYTIDLDFSQFDSVAAVLRTMELLAAGIGLALTTKRLIQGGD